jgi:hypothetical protein
MVMRAALSLLARSEARDMKATDNFNNSILSSVAG